MTRSTIDRRQAIIGMGAALMMSAAKQAVAADGDFAARLAEMQRDGRVSGLHALLVARGGRTLFEYYGVGEDERLGTSLGTVTGICSVGCSNSDTSRSISATASS